MISADMISAVANHLWQSTAVAAVVGLLVLALRSHHARIRYALWMVASVKFLLPFSLLVVMGSALRPASAPPVVVHPMVSQTIERMAVPFSSAQPANEDFSTEVRTVEQTASSYSLWPIALIGIWAGGFLAVMVSSARRWLRVWAFVRTASAMGRVGDVEVRSSDSLLEPGVFGILRPVLLLPEGISDRLTEAQLGAIVEHEMCHVRRRDNLAAAFHMLVEAVFWFHPLVWWIGSRLVEERERACDEAVLQAGRAAEDYAEGILKVCKLYLQSPLTCVSGVTGADLKERIVRIVTQQVARKLDFSRKALLCMMAAAAVVSPIGIGLLRAGQAANAADVTGSWQGTLQVGRDLRTVLKVSKADSGLKGAFYSIDQGGQSIPVSSVTLQGSTFKFAITMIDGSYEGKLSSDGNTITGTWKQGPNSLPLVLKRATPETAWAIPEPPPKVAPMAADAKPAFEVATIKPAKPDEQGKGFLVKGRHFSTMNTSLMDLITFTYGMHPKQIVGGPAWLTQDKFDLEAQPEGEGQPSEKQWKEMVKKLLADRYKLAFHHDQKELSVYELVVAKNGPKLTPSQGDPNGLPGLFFRGLGDLNPVNANMDDLARVLQEAVLDRPVVDHTNLKGRFDFSLKWTPDETQFPGFGGKIPPPSNAADAPPSLFTAIQEQIGLKLDSTKAPVDVLVIDKVEKPSAN